MMTITPDITAEDLKKVGWVNTGDKIFFGMLKNKPVVKIVGREKTCYVPACKMTKFLQHESIAQEDHKTGVLEVRPVLVL